uniref:Uncharacterized protein n=1 Tax=Aegilops tauschii subsp. strangulata TaxID=200361 RepID=A0A453L6T4_AEGTS
MFCYCQSLYAISKMLYVCTTIVLLKEKNKYYHIAFSLKGSLGAVVKLLPCDHEVTGSSPGNSLLQKCRERLRTIDPKWSDPSPDPAQAGATCTGAALFILHFLSF